jgi:hypothetical protein
VPIARTVFYDHPISAEPSLEAARSADDRTMSSKVGDLPEQDAHPEAGLCHMTANSLQVPACRATNAVNNAEDQLIDA